MKIFHKKDQEKVSKIVPENNAVENAFITKKQIPETDEIRPFHFSKHGFEILWNATKNHYVIFINPEIYDLPIPIMYKLNEKLSDLFFEFYWEEKNKQAKKEYENVRLGRFIDGA